MTDELLKTQREIKRGKSPPHASRHVIPHSLSLAAASLPRAKKAKKKERNGIKARRKRKTRGSARGVRKDRYCFPFALLSEFCHCFSKSETDLRAVSGHTGAFPRVFGSNAGFYPCKPARGGARGYKDR